MEPIFEMSVSLHEIIREHDENKHENWTPQ